MADLKEGTQGACAYPYCAKKKAPETEIMFHSLKAIASIIFTGMLGYDRLLSLL